MWINLFSFKSLFCFLELVSQPGMQVGWWLGISYDDNDAYGSIIHISVEYGKYVARTYSPR